MSRCEGYPKFCGAPIRSGRYCADCLEAKQENDRETAATIAIGRPQERKAEYWSSRKQLSKLYHRRTIIREVLLTWGRDCHLCGQSIAPDDLSLDHLQPRSKGGLTTVNNLRAAHKTCNVARGNDPLSLSA